MAALTCEWSGGSLGEGGCEVKMGGWVGGLGGKKIEEEDEST